MNNKIRRWHIAGTIFIIVFGTLLHFVYEWAGNSTIAGIFGAVNESTWEHLKLLFWPAVIFSIIEYIFVGHEYNNFFAAKAISFYVGIISIIVLFYTYTGIMGDNYLAADIAVFIISVIISQIVSYKFMTSDKKVSWLISLIAIVMIIILIFAFVYFTFEPPQIPLFQDPITGSYGVMSRVADDYALYKDKDFLNIGDRYSDEEIYAILGTPLKETVTVLDHGADTYAGSSVKVLDYQGASIELFSPKDNLKDYWIKSVTINEPIMRTTKEITVGSTLTDLTSAYDGLEIALDGRTDVNNCAYILSNQEEHKYMLFEVAEGVVAQVKLYVELP